MTTPVPASAAPLHPLSPAETPAPTAVPGAPAPVSAAPPGVASTRWLAAGSLLGLIVLCLAWEIALAPLRPGGSWLALKALPLCLPLAGILKNRMYTYRWVSLVVWLYFTEGVVRATSDRGLSAGLATVEVVLCLVLFVACAMHVRLRLRGAQAAGQLPAASHAAVPAPTVPGVPPA